MAMVCLVPHFQTIYIFLLTAAGGAISISKQTLKAVNASAEYSVELAPRTGRGLYSLFRGATSVTLPEYAPAGLVLGLLQG